jgi:hypothetical protein
MPDFELQNLSAATANETSDPLDTPGPSSLNYLASRDLSEEEIEMLLGDAPGLSWADMKEDAQAFFFRLRGRVARIVCNDQELSNSVNQALVMGAEAAWMALVGALGLSAETAAAAALKPIAVGLTTSGLSRLCRNQQ